MRCALSFGTLVAAILVLNAGTASANSRTLGEVCIQQNGVYLANIRMGFAEYGATRWSYEDKTAVAVGQSHCFPFGTTDEEAFISVAVIWGQTKECRFSLKNRSGRLTATTSGTTLNVGLTCP